MLACLFDELFKSLSTDPNMYGFRNTNKVGTCAKKGKKSKPLNRCTGWDGARERMLQKYLPTVFEVRCLKFYYCALRD